MLVEGVLVRYLLRDERPAAGYVLEALGGVWRGSVWYGWSKTEESTGGILNITGDRNMNYHELDTNYLGNDSH